MAWSRPSGPVRIWNNVKITDSNGVNREFVIQEIPIEKYDEAIDHMSNIFSRDETILSYFKIADDPVALSAMRKTWNLVIQQGISIAAYDITKNPDEPILAGVNLLFFGNNKFEETLMTIEYEGNLKKLFNFVLGVCHEVDPRFTHGVDGYLGAFGLSVDPNYRRLGLGKIILNARDAIGEKYNIKYTSTIFTSEISQKIAACCEFIVKMDRPYDSVIDEDGNKLFATLKEKNFKIMEKVICPVRIWNNVEITDSNGINREFVIQEIPKEKYVEAVDHMCNIFLRDETMSSYFKIADDPVAVSALRKLWNLVIQQGISIAAYDITENPEKPILAGVNILFFKNKEFEETLMAIEYEGNLKKIYNFASQIHYKVDPRYTYGVDGYLDGLGLSVDPNYRQLGLGKIILKTRDAIGEQYNIQYTSSAFTGEISQKMGFSCEYIVKIDQPYCDVIDEDGNKLFATLNEKNYKIMEKKIC